MKVMYNSLEISPAALASLQCIRRPLYFMPSSQEQDLSDMLPESSITHIHNWFIGVLGSEGRYFMSRQPSTTSRAEVSSSEKHLDTLPYVAIAPELNLRSNLVCRYLGGGACSVFSSHSVRLGRDVVF
jgi:hypothetical protein